MNPSTWNRLETTQLPSSINQELEAKLRQKIQFQLLQRHLEEQGVPFHFSGRNQTQTEYQILPKLKTWVPNSSTFSPSTKLLAQVLTDYSEHGNLHNQNSLYFKSKQKKEMIKNQNVQVHKNPYLTHSSQTLFPKSTMLKKTNVVIETDEEEETNEDSESSVYASSMEEEEEEEEEEVIEIQNVALKPTRKMQSKERKQEYEKPPVIHASIPRHYYSQKPTNPSSVTRIKKTYINKNRNGEEEVDDDDNENQPLYLMKSKDSKKKHHKAEKESKKLSHKIAIKGWIDPRKSSEQKLSKKLQQDVEASFTPDTYELHQKIPKKQQHKRQSKLIVTQPVTQPVPKPLPKPLPKPITQTIYIKSPRSQPKQQQQQQQSIPIKKNSKHKHRKYVQTVLECETEDEITLPSIQQKPSQSQQQTNEEDDDVENIPYFPSTPRTQPLLLNSRLAGRTSTGRAVYLDYEKNMYFYIGNDKSRGRKRRVRIVPSAFIHH